MFGTYRLFNTFTHNQPQMKSCRAHTHRDTQSVSTIGCQENISLLLKFAIQKKKMLSLWRGAHAQRNAMNLWKHRIGNGECVCVCIRLSALYMRACVCVREHNSQRQQQQQPSKQKHKQRKSTNEFYSSVSVRHSKRLDGNVRLKPHIYNALSSVSSIYYYFLIFSSFV